MRLQFISCICCFFLAATASTLTLADEIENSNRSPSLSAEPLRQNEQRDIQLTSVQVAIYPPVALEPTAQKKPEQDSGGERNLFGWNSSRRPSRRPTPRRPTRRPTHWQEMNEIPTLYPSFSPSRRPTRRRRRPTRRPTRRPNAYDQLPVCENKTVQCGPSKQCPSQSPGGPGYCCSQYGVSTSIDE